MSCCLAPMQILRILAVSFAICVLASGKTVGQEDKAAKTEQSDKAKSDAAAEAAKNKNKKGKPKAPPPKAEPPPPQPVVHDMSAMKTVVRIIEDSVDLSPTLVVWL